MPRPMLLLLFLTLGLAPTAAQAHEMWIEPLDYRPAPGGTLTANLMNGQFFSGRRFAYYPEDFVRFEIWHGSDAVPVEGRLGDRPAARIDGLPEGLAILVYQSEPTDLIYREWDKFADFVEHKDFRGVFDRHRERGLPMERFREVYSRFAKSLIGVGGGAGKDREVGLETEILALANPYTAGLESLPVQVLYQGAPRKNAQVELFEKPSGEDAEAVITRHRTDDRGIVRLPVKPRHRYLVDAVVLREPRPALAEKWGAVWESLWASLTFAVPARMD